MEDSMSNNEEFNYPEYSVLGPELTSFMMQVGFVEGIVSEALEFSSISEAFRHLFRNNKEYAVLLWNGIPLQLSYIEDIPFIAEDIVELLEAIQAKKKTEVHLKTENIEVVLNVSHTDEELTIIGDFVKVPGHSESAFTPLKMVKIGREVFLAEWKMLLSQCVEAMKGSGYKFRSIATNTFMKRLIQLNESIEQRGMLYS